MLYTSISKPKNQVAKCTKVEKVTDNYSLLTNARMKILASAITEVLYSFCPLLPEEPRSPGEENTQRFHAAVRTELNAIVQRNQPSAFARREYVISRGCRMNYWKHHTPENMSREAQFITQKFSVRS